jgi:hypothetical protein
MEEAHVISRMAEEEQTELVDILYHTAFPDVDSTNLKNEVDPSARALFYSVENVPTTVMDGMYKINQISDNDTVKYRSFTLKETRFKINLEIDYSRGPNEIPIKSIIEATDTLSQPVIIYTAIVQRYMHGPHPMRFLTKMLPDAAGISITTPWSFGEKKENEVTWYSQNLISNEELGVIIFIQNKKTKEVYQSIYQKLEVLPGAITGMENEPGLQEDFGLFPNPANDKLHLTLPHIYRENLQYYVQDAVGKLVLDGIIVSGKQITDIDTSQLPGGLYTIQVRDDKKLLSLKKLVVRH